jgi:hypothetical protein
MEKLTEKPLGSPDVTRWRHNSSPSRGRKEPLDVPPYLCTRSSLLPPGRGKIEIRRSSSSLSSKFHSLSARIFPSTSSIITLLQSRYPLAAPPVSFWLFYCTYVQYGVQYGTPYCMLREVRTMAQWAGLGRTILASLRGDTYDVRIPPCGTNGKKPRTSTYCGTSAAQTT